MKDCPLKCPISRAHVLPFILCVLVGYAFVFAFEFFWNVILLMPTYLETPALWRPQEAMQDYRLLGMLRIFLLVGVVAVLYIQKHEGKGIAEGIRFGTLVGLILGLVMGSSYIWMPISVYLASMWFLGGFLTGLGLGIINALIFKRGCNT